MNKNEYYAKSQHPTCKYTTQSKTNYLHLNKYNLED